MRKTKIIATIGPSSSSSAMIGKLIKAGMDSARLNFSHGTHDSHLKILKEIRKISERFKKPVAILQDLQGPKIRIENFKNNVVTLKKGMNFTITTRTVTGNEKIVGTTYKKLHLDVKPGNILLLNDGLIQLKVIEIKKRDILSKVKVGGILSNNKGINLPGVKISEQSLTKKDKEDLLFGINNNVDYVALSFVRNAGDIKKVKSIIKKFGKNIKVIAKIEKPEAVKNIESILKEADGIMVARGDLGVEMSPESVPSIQKKLIVLASDYNKISITATQMLESMVKNFSPTRAEASDIANAVYDGTDTVMLSAETASGKYPLESLRMMHKIAYAAETNITGRKRGYFTSDTDNSPTRAMAEAALLTCEEIKGKAIIVFTASGATARLISKNRRHITIIALTPDPKVFYQLALIWGVIPMFIQYTKNTDNMILEGKKILLSAGLLKRGNRVIFLSGNAPYAGSTNMIKIETI